MKRQRRNFSLPTIRKFRDAIENGKLGNFLIGYAEECSAGSVKLKYNLKNKPWVVTLEARRIYKK